MVTNKTKNDIIINALIILNMINIIYNCKQNILPTVITIILIAIFFYLYNFTKIDKHRYLLTAVMISLTGPLMESIIIHFSNGNSWSYKHPFLNWYVPLWLLPGYGILGMSAVHYYFNM